MVILCFFWGGELVLVLKKVISVDLSHLTAITPHTMMHHHHMQLSFGFQRPHWGKRTFAQGKFLMACGMGTGVNLDLGQQYQGHGLSPRMWFGFGRCSCH